MSIGFGLFMNLYELGYINKENNMNIFVSNDNDYKIELSRKETKLWKQDSFFNYFCKLCFVNSLGNKVFEITMSEIEASILIDNMEEILNNLSVGNQLHVPIDYTITNGFIHYEFVFIKHEEYISIQIIENNTICRIRMNFYYDTFEELIEMMFFTFIIDIYDELNDIKEVY